jgi:hypothetical protein
VRSTRCAIPYIQPSARSYTPMHTCMPTYQIRTRVHALHVSLPSLQYTTQTRPATTHLCEQIIYCTHLSVFSVELWASAAAICCAPSAPMEILTRLYAHVCERNNIAHVRSSRCAIPYIEPSARLCAHACRLQEVPQLDVLVRFMKELH